ncbi:unnamed protein product [Rhizoctonia solani]|uniref:Uncharacterized protein n=1 Tax=Rhizoctonia solani TaxID=456999 RepID=A0A8H3CF92_9AGAM|nr:unnamed protein product [Rhizoctonia solani]
MPVQFDPKIHLAYSPPESCITMEELGQAGEGLSPVGVTQPFPLLSEEGVRAIREELFTSEIFDRVTDLLGQLRGMSSRPGFAPFNEALWTHPETNRIVSEAAGVELVPIMPYELGHINVQLNSGKETFTKLGREPLCPKAPDNTKPEAVVPKLPEPKIDPDVMEWHRDSYPWVCIVMLSDATNMQGGETIIGSADGTMQKVRGPRMGWAMVLQGGYVDHAALGAYDGQERITMVTSY